MEIWVEFSRFKTTKQRLADQVRKIIKKGWFSGLKILEIYRETYQPVPNTVIEMLNTEKPETSNQIQTLDNSNRTTTHPNTTQQTLTQEEKMNVELMKRIMSEKKTTLPSLRN